jgi:hypothetical protein
MAVRAADPISFASGWLPSWALDRLKRLTNLVDLVYHGGYDEH